MIREESSCQGLRFADPPRSYEGFDLERFRFDREKACAAGIGVAVSAKSGAGCEGIAGTEGTSRGFEDFDFGGQRAGR